MRPYMSCFDIEGIDHCSSCHNEANEGYSDLNQYSIPENGRGIRSTIIMDVCCCCYSGITRDQIARAVRKKRVEWMSDDD